MKKITLLLLFVACYGFSQAQTLFTEDFNYAIGSDIKSQGWPIHSGSGANPDSILVVDGLTFTGYPGSGIGGAAAVTGRYCDHNHKFTGQTSGTTYAAFMVKSLGAGAGNTASYFFHFGPTTLSTTYFSRIWVNATGTGLGIGGTTPTTFSPITVNTTYLVVLKYDFASKVSSFYVFSTMPTTEPTTAAGTFTETTGPAAATPTDIGTVVLRQNQTTSLANQNVVVDGIRIATSWAALFNSSGVNNTQAQSLKVWGGNGKVNFNAAQGEKVEVFNAVGQKMLSQLAVEGENQLSVNNKGMTIVKVGNRVGKVIL